MKYLKCIWFNAFEDEPVLIYSEIDNERNETRKVEFFRNGKIAYATENIEHYTFLGLEPMPNIANINDDNEFFALEISKKEFEIVWEDMECKQHENN